MSTSTENFEKTKQLAIQLAKWDRRIVEIAVINDLQQNDEEKVDLICSFIPEPTSDTTGFFWIASLMTRMEFEALDERLGVCQPFDLGFKIAEQVFLPNGKILSAIGDHVILWPDHEE